MRISILTRSLTRGGAQIQAVALARGLARRGHLVSIVCFYSDGALAGGLGKDRVTLVNLRKSGRFGLLAPLGRLLKHLREFRSDVVYSFLPLENLFGLVAAKKLSLPIVWGIRGAGVNRGQYGLASRFLYGSQFALLKMPNAVICNSQAAADEIVARNLAALHVVPNGIDCARFTNSLEHRVAWRTSRGIAEDRRLIGIVARLDPMKDHENFLRAAAIICNRAADVDFMVVGNGPEAYARRLRGLAQELGVGDRVQWLGEIADPVAVYRGIDVMVSASAYGEGFSNALGEAMATGTAVVATDVGDARRIVAEHGKIVPVRDSPALADAITSVLAHDSLQARELRARWIADQFGIEAMVVRTEAVLRRVTECN